MRSPRCPSRWGCSSPPFFGTSCRRRRLSPRRVCASCLFSPSSCPPFQHRPSSCPFWWPYAPPFRQPYRLKQTPWLSSIALLRNVSTKSDTLVARRPNFEAAAPKIPLPCDFPCSGVCMWPPPPPPPARPALEPSTSVQRDPSLTTSVTFRPVHLRRRPAGRRSCSARPRARQAVHPGQTAPPPPQTPVPPPPPAPQLAPPPPPRRHPRRL